MKKPWTYSKYSHKQRTKLHKKKVLLNQIENKRKIKEREKKQKQWTKKYIREKKTTQSKISG